MKDWFYDESNHVGVDYSKLDNVNDYDSQMESFRDYEKEVIGFFDKLNASNPGDLTVIDMGCGTGAFAIHASRYFRHIHAVDVSQGMLDIASSKASAGDIGNIEFNKSGFLQFKPAEQVDIIYTKWAFHHLPDYWKQAGLLNMNRILKTGGVLFLSDLVFEFDPDYETNTDTFINEISKGFGKEFADETKLHIRDEFSTFDWILQGLIERAGFNIEQTDTSDSLANEYFCRKIKSF